ncbi:CaiB/BaiF CoA-transferase family protein [Streptomyces sp. NBC_00120]|uniref:CaiB/BaiF CoA transferase family protein n=1 Tax=Streptomyces sp. NBC_00120 TaxID=2975660 RepID=UPI00224F4FF8|nr:CaiB/BaiF CoA-transferase family protein [Streptomyces sp. NBC_00120]MCX5320339.1 CoA transferase [Streptomyces sp. NBC_00120]
MAVDQPNSEGVEHAETAETAERAEVAGDAHGGPPDWSFLTGKRVLDLSRLLPGPYATSMLADVGADVIKIEEPDGGDPARSAPALFEALNRNKRSVTLDLRDDTHRAEFLRLVGTADAVVESFRPGVLDRLGLSYPVLREANLRIVLCSLSGYGQTGPYANRPGHELNFLGLSGFFTVPGRIDGEITRPGVRVGDMAGAMQAAFALTVALAGAAATGHGQHIDVSLAESIAGWCALFALPQADAGDPLKSGLVQGDNDVFRTADGRLLSLATFEDKFWRELRTALGTEFPGLDTDAYDRRPARTAAKEKVHHLLTAVFATHDYAWWEHTLTGIGAPWAPVFTAAQQLLDDPHLTARNLFSQASGPAPQARFPVRFGSGLNTFRTPAPELGAHTREVLEAMPAAQVTATSGPRPPARRQSRT